MASLVSNVVTYNAKVWIAGLLAALFVPLPLCALVVELLTKSTEDTGALSQRVLRASANAEAWLDIHGQLTDVRVTDPAPTAS